MIQNNGRTFLDDSEDMPLTGDISLTVEVRRLRFEHDRLQRRLTALYERSGSHLDGDALRNLVIHIARHLNSLRTDSLKLYESEFVAAFHLSSQQIDRISRVLFAGAVAELSRRISTRGESNALRGGLSE